MNDPSEDRSKFIYPALAIGLLTAAFVIIKTGRDALFFQGGGIFQLPVATMIIAAASLPLAILFVKAMKVWGARPARIGILFFAWLTLATVIVWLGITQKMRIQVKKEQVAAGKENAVPAERECERFPDQCPCTTELGKGVP